MSVSAKNIADDEAVGLFPSAISLTQSSSNSSIPSDETTVFNAIKWKLFVVRLVFDRITMQPPSEKHSIRVAYT